MQVINIHTLGLSLACKGGEILARGFVDTNRNRSSEKSFRHPVPYPSSRFNLTNGLHLPHSIADALCFSSAEIRDSPYVIDRPVALRLGKLIVIAHYRTEEFEKLERRLEKRRSDTDVSIV